MVEGDPLLTWLGLQKVQLIVKEKERKARDTTPAAPNLWLREAYSGTGGGNTSCTSEGGG